MEIFKIIYSTLIAFIAIIALLLIVSILPITGNIKFMTVISGSMEPAIKIGSVVMVKPANDYNIGDVITFGQVTKTKAPTSHRIYDIKVVDGQPVYITKGDTNNAPDAREVPKKEVLGKVMFSVPYLGYAVNSAKQPLGFAVIIITPALIIIFDEVKNIYGEIKKEKTNEAR
ncbi:signal peptidase I [Patescibacteria group bacterium]|nr:signal peptidase I [Patescibacteria group bacterium]MBU1876816.1 signal peptidase I [Patescibacteria group bacterium]